MRTPWHRDTNRERVALLPWQLVTVRGPSMVPVLRDADVVVVRHGAPVRRGDVVLARFRTLPDRLVLKRAARPSDGGWWLVSDNVLAGGDSSVHGVADVLARVELRLRRAEPARGRWPCTVRRVRALRHVPRVADSTTPGEPRSSDAPAP